ncbi:TonB-dependent receptor [Pinirhizobacter sp.]|uniref:TonB-dependent receptor n=1 Tax=Pinirhizobacter sp. TaxID=2950432 RepID=UPI002F41CF18
MNTKIHTRRKVLALALLAGMGATSGAFAQSTVGTIYGSAPIGGNETVLLESNSGIRREIAVDAKGRYVASQLPVGTYAVTLRRDGAAIDSRKNIQLTVGGSADVSFAAAAAASAENAQNLSAVSVTAAALPAIDVTTVDSRTVITSEQLAKLPLGRNAEAIAKLAPGVNTNTGNFTGPTGKQLVSFGGASATENAYYINGFNTTDPLFGAGGLTLPYGAIDQQEVYTGGYSAQYGRSDGGVINQVGKRGTNEWHFGAQVLWEPQFARADQRNVYYGNGYPGLYDTVPKAPPPSGTLYIPRAEDNSWVETVSAYAGGPLIKDKLYLFIAAEYERDQARSVTQIGATNPAQTQQYNNPRWYAKVDWNITDNNIIEVTGASDKREGSGTYYAFDYVNRQRGAATGPMDTTKQGGTLGIIKYTGYITDDLTIDALYGKYKTHDYDVPGAYNPDLVYITNPLKQNPALNGGVPRFTNQLSSLADPGRGNEMNNLRVNITYHWGDHTIVAGIDNQNSRANNIGTVNTGPGYSYNYGSVSDPSLSPAGGVPPLAGFPDGQSGYYVSRNVANSTVSVRSTQRAQYLEDTWQVSDRWMVKAGIRNDQFTIYNPSGDAFITETKPQWSPRLGFSWDVNGDSSFKVFGNAGRYYLSLPLNPATGAAAGYIATQTYFTYSGIDAQGVPTGLTQMAPAVSANNSFGQQPDPRTVTGKNIGAENQDEYILGFNKQLTDKYVWGVKATYRKLNNAIDDFCDVNLVTAKAAAQGIDVGSTNSCYLINPGRANTFVLIDTAGNPQDVKLSNKEMGFQGLKRRYYGLDFFMEHPFDGTWYGKINYTFSRSYGNTEGQVRSDLLQLGGSASEDWDNGTIMEYANGRQNNDHTHVLKFFGYYQVSPEWQVSGNISMSTGQPKICLGAYGPDYTDPVDYGNAYHWCNGQPSPPGSHGSLPWTHPLDLGVTYRPAWGDSKLAFAANVFNVFNEQRPTFLSVNSTDGGNSTPLYTYNSKYLSETPRYARFSVSYDF